MKVYIVCPVRQSRQEEREIMDAYAKALERRDIEVHYPPRDVNQNGDITRICREHRSFMIDCDEVHVFWNVTSGGSHFDLGMAYALNKKIVLIKSFLDYVINGKSFQKVIEKLQEENEDYGI